MNKPRTHTVAAISVWNGRIAPVFDVGRRLLVLEIHDKRILNRTEIDLGRASPAERVQRLVQLRVQVLVCGAVSRPLLTLLRENAIRVHPFIAGDVNEVIDALLRGNLDAPPFCMPGCARRRRFRGGARNATTKERSPTRQQRFFRGGHPPCEPPVFPG